VSEIHAIEAGAWAETYFAVQTVMTVVGTVVMVVGAVWFYFKHMR
jgi:hypothetical protein